MYFNMQNNNLTSLVKSIWPKLNFNEASKPTTNPKLISTRLSKLKTHKPECVVRMIVDSILPHTECGPNDHRKNAPRLQTSQA